MCPAVVFANSRSCETGQLRARLRGPWRQGLRAVMMLLSVRGLAAGEIAALLECHPSTVRRWIGRITALLQQPGPWTVRRATALRATPSAGMRIMLYRRSLMTSTETPVCAAIVATRCVTRTTTIPFALKNWQKQVALAVEAGLGSRGTALLSPRGEHIHGVRGECDAPPGVRGLAAVPAGDF
jgi:Homeodomain-like domain